MTIFEFCTFLGFGKKQIVTIVVGRGWKNVILPPPNLNTFTLEFILVPI